MEKERKAHMLEKTDMVRVMGSQHGRSWTNLGHFPIDDYHRYGIEQYKSAWDFIRVVAYDSATEELGILEEWDALDMELAHNGRLYPKEEPTYIDRECQIRRLKGELNKVTRESKQMYDWFRECQDYTQEIRETIDYLEQKEFVEGKGILKIDDKGMKIGIKPKQRKPKSAKAAIKKSGGPGALLDTLRKANPKKYAEVIQAMIDQGADLPPGHGLED